MLKVILIGLIIIVAIVAALISYSCCVISGRSSRQEELERIHRKNSLTDLENETLESLLKAFHEDGVGFVINDGKVIDYEVEE